MVQTAEIIQRFGGVWYGLPKDRIITPIDPTLGIQRNYSHLGLRMRLWKDETQGRDYQKIFESATSQSQEHPARANEFLPLAFKPFLQSRLHDVLNPEIQTALLEGSLKLFDWVSNWMDPIHTTAGEDPYVPEVGTDSIDRSGYEPSPLYHHLS
ncbi:MAG: hypothetical protein WCO06_05535 [Candidatus Roizmanbacteria bacterium]